MFICSFALVLSCEKDNNVEKLNKVETEHRKISKRLYPDDSLSTGEPSTTIPPFVYTSPIQKKAIVVSGILKFATIADFENTVNQLELEFENFNGYDPYIELYGSNLNAMDDALDLNGVDEDIIYSSYEAKYSGFTSLRKRMLNSENSFLNVIGNTPESPNNPQNSMYFNDDVFNTLLNSKGEIIVENIIFKVFDNGMSYAITNGDLNLLKNLTAPVGLPVDYYSKNIFKGNANVVFLSPQVYCELNRLPGETLPNDDDYCSFNNLKNSSASDNCKLWIKKTERTVLYENNKRAISNLRLINIGIWNCGTTKIVNYKQKNGKYKRSRQYLQCSMQQIGNLSCGSAFEKAENRIRLRKSRRMKIAGRKDPLLYTAGQMIWSFTCFVYILDVDCRTVTLRAENGKYSCNNKCGDFTTSIVATW